VLSEISGICSKVDMNEFIQLLSILTTELKAQEDLLRLLARERTAIVHVNQEEIEAVSSTKDHLFEDLKKLVTTRNEAIYRLAGKYLSQETIQLDHLIAKCPQPKTRAELARVREEIKKSAQAIDELNQLNGQLIRKTLGLVSSTVSLLAGGGAAEAETYLSSGNVRKEEELNVPALCRSLNKEV